ncbi:MULTISPECIES: GNAT family N-acetyltransferase [unclassified Sulfitobacter]|nr:MULTISPECIES: GNAT family N-acetyltransferase [unclassified Sulfitobacter]MDF3422570.1 GNAT family N-acetyltransferase [Sulfitobacter sp. KE43]MDF3474718.1 GNAT family N-acetyltransferase [Sulfitobacter sp. M48]MDF3498126.1 GNAT family N-acetyltransferase [Sulfitobacter sp. M56]MDF3517632.1 GNAT family N-acetyltransferase [Sulfitobacter sp. M63]MDF3537143.1 GNAT family N-acetyltransferase [Sulfitobacter sp. M71]MDF3541046.1 GNAT family N-acetyltransferase [Sulfitobacter sp. M62]
MRRLHASDQKEICEHFIRLDAGTRRSRFCGSINDAEIAKYAAKIFDNDSIICGAFFDGILRGIVELRGSFHSWPRVTEAAFSVEKDWQNIGIGDALFDQIFARAQNRGIRTIQMLCLRENSRMRHLAAKHNATLQFDEDGVQAVLHPHWPTPVSVATEFRGEAIGFLHLMFGWRKLGAR